MLHPHQLTRRAFSAIVPVMLLSPLLASMHHHEMDHDGAIPHFERDHGGHDHTPVELDERLTSNGPTPSPALVTGWSLPDRLWVHTVLVSSDRVFYPARPPPAPLQARAPPPLT
jgi:hypothetical protein